MVLGVVSIRYGTGHAWNSLSVPDIPNLVASSSQHVDPNGNRVEVCFQAAKDQLVRLMNHRRRASVKTARDTLLMQSPLEG